MTSLTTSEHDHEEISTPGVEGQSRSFLWTHRWAVNSAKGLDWWSSAKAYIIRTSRTILVGVQEIAEKSIIPYHSGLKTCILRFFPFSASAVRLLRRLCEVFQPRSIHLKIVRLEMALIVL